MYFRVRFFSCLAGAVMLLLGTASATSLSRLSFEELTDTSDIIATGVVVRSWSAWDANRKYIWTHYEVAVTQAVKGVTAGASVELAEPGGVADGTGMTIAGSVHYTPGEHVAVFGQRMPNGFLRTTGWGQGKYAVDRTGFLHADTALRDTELVDAGKSARGTPLHAIDGLTVREFSARVAARIHAVQAPGRAR